MNSKEIQICHILEAIVIFNPVFKNLHLPLPQPFASTIQVKPWLDDLLLTF